MYDDEYYNAFSKWCADHYGWSFPKEQLCITPGIIPALYQLAETLCTKDEKVLINTPAYGYFAHAAEYAGVDILTSPLKKKADGTFEQMRRPELQARFLVQSAQPDGKNVDGGGASPRGRDHGKV